MKTGITVKTIRSKSVLNKSKIFDYCLNPYTGAVKSIADIAMNYVSRLGSDSRPDLQPA
jgi:hypothetical protein